VTDQDIRIVSREAFPDFAALVGAFPAAVVMPGVRSAVGLPDLPKGQAPGTQRPGAANPPGGTAGKKGAGSGSGQLNEN
jgi:hypothetical protein